ncbi:MAG TPA: trehalose-phosphatase [Candidatus Omnitrophota bacterium]|nr:trehalose-phosphatase [Candidatus Omnitrophota bacterium]
MPKLRESLRGKFILLFLDFDGTLSPIADTPAKATIPKETIQLLKGLSRQPQFKLVIISGRALKDLKEKIGLGNIVYVGNHGLELEGPKLKFEAQVSSAYKSLLKQIKSYFYKELSSVKGIFIEDKGLSLSLHYRLAEKKDIARVKSIFQEAVSSHLVKNKIKIYSGKMVSEIRPPAAWDKGRMALWILYRQKFILKGEPLLPIYVGDDITDEDAFKALRGKGVTIFVGRPKPSFAQYYLKDTNEVAEFLKFLCQN